MKALSIRQPWASLVALGEKTVEWRTWRTSYRGDLVICSAKSPHPPVDGVKLPCGFALAVARLADCRPLATGDLPAAKLSGLPNPRGWAWEIEDVRQLQPQPISGRQGLFDLDICPLYLPSDTTHLDYYNRFMV